MPERIPEILTMYDKRSLNQKGPPFVLFRYKKCGMVEKDAQMLLSFTEQLLVSMGKVLVEEGAL